MCQARFLELGSDIGSTTEVKCLSTVVVAQHNVCTAIRLAQTATFSSIFTARPANCAMLQSTLLLHDSACFTPLGT